MRLLSLVGSPVGIIVAAVVWQALVHIVSVSVVAARPERIGLACVALLPAVCVLDLMIVVQMALRARTGAVDPLAGHDSRLLQVNQRALTNTVEQLAGFAPSLLALAAAAPPAWMPFVVAAGLAFALARLVFWGDYLLGPMLRAPGMAASFAINVATLGAAVWVWLQ
jgi:uncharacterized membrane protein YecN with MAPEG domain